MSNDIFPRGSPATNEIPSHLRIDRDNADDLGFWSVVFEVTPREIAHAVSAVGADAAAVERFIRYRRAHFANADCL